VKPAVLNASPLIILARCGHLEYAGRNPGTTAILDDKAARRAARTLGIPVIGTLGLLAAAVRSKLLPSLPDAIEAVRASGLYVDPALVSALVDAR